MPFSPSPEGTVLKRTPVFPLSETEGEQVGPMSHDMPNNGGGRETCRTVVLGAVSKEAVQ